MAIQNRAELYACVRELYPLAEIVRVYEKERILQGYRDVLIRTHTSRMPPMVTLRVFLGGMINVLHDHYEM